MKKTLSLFIALMIIGSVTVHARRLDKPTALGMAVVKSGSTFKVFYKGAKRAKITVTIYNNNDQTVLVDYIGKMDSFVRPYDFSALPKGEYVIELKHEDGTQTERVNFINDETATTYISLAKVAARENTYMLGVSKKGKDAITVRILNESGETLYTNTEFTNGDFAKLYNLKSVKGHFTFEVSNDHGIVKTFKY